MAANKIKFEILEDGTVSIKTDDFSPANHKSADDLLDEIEELLGGTRTTEHVKEHHNHVHRHIVERVKQQ